MNRLCAIAALCFGLLGLSPAAHAQTVAADNLASKVTVASYVHNSMNTRILLEQQQSTHRVYESKRIKAYKYALKQKGKPYIWGGTGPFGFDCSGLVFKSYEHAHIYLGRTVADMVYGGKLRRIRESRARKGDLVVFNGTQHVELFDGKWRYLWTYGAADPGTFIAFHKQAYPWWWEIRFYRVKDSGDRIRIRS